MSLPYSNCTSGKRAITEIEKTLSEFGCKKFATGQDYESGDLFVQFEHNDRIITLSCNAKQYAAMWLKENPHTYRMQKNKKEHEARALEIGQIAIYSVLRDWIKGQITAIQCGLFSFDAMFLSHTMLPSGILITSIPITYYHHPRCGIMRVNVYSQELTPEVILTGKVSNTNIKYQAAQLILHSSDKLHHTPEDDDRSAVTFWLPKSSGRREEMARAFDMIAHIFRSAPLEQD